MFHISINLIIPNRFLWPTILVPLRLTTTKNANKFVHLLFSQPSKPYAMVLQVHCQHNKMHNSVQTHLKLLLILLAILYEAIHQFSMFVVGCIENDLVNEVY